MGYTVVHPAGMTRDAEFQAYARLLRQSGIDLGRVPRVPEPGTNHRWLYVWDTEAAARAFAAELAARTGGTDWRVVEANAPPSEGPLGPLVVLLARGADDLTFSLHPLSRALLRSAFPDAVPSTTDSSIDAQTWHTFRRTKGTLDDLVREILGPMTGLDAAEFDPLGYVVIDADTDRTLVSHPPALAATG